MRREAVLPFARFFYRRRVLLAMLAHGEEPMERTRLQKLLFLLTRQQEKPAYDFIPYKYGCYSFSVAEDARILAQHYHLLEEGEQSYALKEGLPERTFVLTAKDGNRLEDTFNRYGSLSLDDLLYRVYEKYPYYATGSTCLDQARFKLLREKIHNARIKPRDKVLYTIGYEGISIEGYINRLIENGVTLLVDVRYRPFSRKYGFSTKQLQYMTGECGIRYISLPELGIPGDKRRNLIARADYDRLFSHYRAELRQKKRYLKKLQDWLIQYPRMAITCFEKQPTDCHRFEVAKAVKARCGVALAHL